MEFRVAYRRTMPGLLLSGFILAVAGCQSGDALKVGNDAATPPAEKVKQSDLLGFCPPVSLREGTAYFNNYAKGGQDDPEKLIYQSSIADVTRTCKRNNGMVAITVAVAGKVVPGPAATGSSLTMPIRVAVVQGSAVVYSELHKHQVTLSPGAPATQFVFNDPNISIAESDLRSIRIYAGYDEGPPKKQTAAAE
ncbi:MAG: hypothetical protein KF914_18135 [Rhizobiaceae bacterium]|nr:hypothetical protein [Rhizobiaceae bacterium]